MKSLKKGLRGSVLALSLMTVAVPAAYAQDAAPAVVESEDDRFDWSWLGLLGLIGLAGLKERNDRDRGVNR